MARAGEQRNVGREPPLYRALPDRDNRLVLRAYARAAPLLFASLGKFWWNAVPISLCGCYPSGDSPYDERADSRAAVRFSDIIIDTRRV